MEAWWSTIPTMPYLQIMLIILLRGSRKRIRKYFLPYGTKTIIWGLVRNRQLLFIFHPGHGRAGDFIILHKTLKRHLSQVISVRMLHWDLLEIQSLIKQTL